MTYKDIYKLRENYQHMFVTDNDLPEDLRFNKDEYIIWVTTLYDDDVYDVKLIDLESPDNMWLDRNFVGNVAHRIKVGAIWLNNKILEEERNQKIETILTK